MLTSRLLPALLLIACNGNDPKNPVAEEEVDLGDPADLVPLIDPFVGTGGVGYEVGCSFPGASLPFGLVKVSPDTGDDAGSAPGFSHTGGYHYDDDHIQGFSHMHMQGVGVAAYGALALFPTDGMTAEKTWRADRGQRFSHDAESAGAGWYTVQFADVDIGVELTATERTALHRYTFGADVATPTVLVDLGTALGNGGVLGGEVQVFPEESKVEGWLVMDGEMGSPYPLYFTAVFDTAPTGWGIWQGGTPEPGVSSASLPVGAPVELGAWLEFPAGSAVAVRVGVSNVDAQGARRNLAVEDNGFDPAADVAAAEVAWESWLSRMRVWGGTDEQQALLATHLFKSLQMPTIFSDVDGRYRGFDGQIHLADWGPYHTDLSLWDTYRTAHPLYTLLWPEAHAAILESLAAMAREGGSIPRWPLANWDGGSMLGTPGTIAFAEAYVKGVRGFDVETLREVALGIADGTRPVSYGGRPDVATYDDLGYNPAEHVGAAVSWTQELAISDYALGKLEEELGDPATAEWLLARSGFWRNHYDPAVGFFHGRYADGSWVPFTTESAWTDDYTEGNARQYLWLVPHDPEGLIDTLGGPERAVERLEEFFAGRREEYEDGIIGFPGSWYWHGNEPGLHTPWLFALAGRPDLTREWVAWVMEHEYDLAPDGIAGNDDGGTLAAWYVFAAMGVYPLSGTDRYVLGQPVFDRVEINVGGGRPFVIRRDGEGEIDRAELNGEELAGWEIRHADIQPGAELVFVAK